MRGTVNIRTWDGRHCYQIIIRHHRPENNKVQYQQYQESTLHVAGYFCSLNEETAGLVIQQNWIASYKVAPWLRRVITPCGA